MKASLTFVSKALHQSFSGAASIGDGPGMRPAQRIWTSQDPTLSAISLRILASVLSQTQIEEIVEALVAVTWRCVSRSASFFRPRKAMWAAPPLTKEVAVVRPMPPDAPAITTVLPEARPVGDSAG